MDLGSVLVVFISTFLALGAALYAYGLANLQEIKDNWVQYRCNPIYMPLADLVGSDIYTNFVNCSLQSTQSYAGIVLDPIYKNFSIVTDTVNMILDAMNDMRAAITGAADGFLSIIQNTFAKIHNTLSTSVQLFSRIRSIINRLMATMAVMMNIVNTGIQTGESIQNGPIGQAADFFCFHPDTLIETSEGMLRIIDIKPGMKLEDGQNVNSTLQLIGGCPMYSVDGVKVSGNHKVKYQSQWIRVEDHPDAKRVPPCDLVYCLNTSKNTIRIGNNIFKDYEESSSIEILSAFFYKVQNFYGTLHSNEKICNPQKYRYTGILPETPVIMKSGNTVLASQIQIGDHLSFGGKVKAVIRHKIRGKTKYNNVFLAPGTWILLVQGVIPSLELIDEEEHEYLQFITERCYYSLGDGTIVLDDHEVNSDPIHTWRDLEVQKEMC
jgi:hypothetical protein